MLDLDEEIKRSTTSEWIYDVVWVHDNVAIIANNDNDEQFWLLLVDKIDIQSKHYVGVIPMLKEMLF
jgi:hypothetical protein